MELHVEDNIIVYDIQNTVKLIFVLIFTFFVFMAQVYFHIFLMFFIDVNPSTRYGQTKEGDHKYQIEGILI